MSNDDARPLLAPGPIHLSRKEMMKMTIGELKQLISAKAITECDDAREIKSGCTCDLLSWVMAHGCADMAWVTVQTHMNVVAVAALLDFACVILPNGIHMPADVAAKASEEDIAVLESELDAFSICSLVYSGGVPGARKE